MSLIDEFMTEFCYMDKKHVSDGEGGFDVEWVEGAHFMAAPTLDTSLEARIAERNGLRAFWKITTRKDVNLVDGDTIRLLSNNTCFAITSKSNHTPNSASLDMRCVNAEEVKLP